MTPQEKEELKQFIIECSAQRDKFCEDINSQQWSTIMRTSAENILIMYDQMQARLAEFPFETQWVKCSEWLPEWNGLYLVVCGHQMQSTNVRHFIDGEWSFHGEDENITHWMPLPKPTKE